MQSMNNRVNPKRNYDEMNEKPKIPRSTKRPRLTRHVSTDSLSKQIAKELFNALGDQNPSINDNSSTATTISRYILQTFKSKARSSECSAHNKDEIREFFCLKIFHV